MYSVFLLLLLYTSNFTYFMSISYYSWTWDMRIWMGREKIIYNSKLLTYQIWMNVAIVCPVEGKGLFIEGKLIKGSFIEVVRMSD